PLPSFQRAAVCVCVRPASPCASSVYASALVRVPFFFQAEDGIRDFHVTGFRRVLFRSLGPWQAAPLRQCIYGKRRVIGAAGPSRSEERRVGKERRPRWRAEL